MKITVSRADTGRWLSGNSMYFRAHDEQGEDVVVELNQRDWDQVKGRYDPLTSVEELAASGRWVPFGAARMWRIGLG